MKLKKIMLITLMLLAILTVGAVSASDDIISDELTVGEETGDEISQVEEVEQITDTDNAQDTVGEGEKTDLSFVEIGDDEDVIPGNRVGGSYLGLYYLTGSNTTGPVTGNVSISIDGKEYYNGLAEECYYSTGQVDLDELYETGNLTFGTHAAVLKFFNDELYNDYTLEKQFNLTYYMVQPVESYISINDHPRLEIYLMPGANGTFTVSLDDKEVFNQFISEEKGYLWLGVVFEDFEVGDHTYVINYEGSCPSFSKSYSFTASYMNIHLNDYTYAGTPVQVIIYLPQDTTQNVTVTYKGKQYEFKPTSQYEWNIVIWNIEDYSLGENEITISYQDDKYPRTEFKKTFTVEPVIRINGGYAYNSGEIINFILSPDATGKFILYFDNKTNKIAEVELINGKGSFTFEDIPIGKYNLITAYEGDEVYKLDDRFDTIKIVPNVIVPEVVNINEECNLTIIVNPDLKPGSISIFKDYGSSLIEHIEITDEGVPSGILEIPLNLSEIGVGGHTIFIRQWITEYGSERFHESQVELNIRDADRNWVPNIEFPEIDLSQHFADVPEYINIITNMIDDGTGNLYLTINDNEPVSAYIGGWNYNGIPVLFGDFVEGVNNWTLTYQGDKYYNDWEVNGTVTASGELKQGINVEIYDDLETIMKDDWKYDVVIDAYICKEYLYFYYQGVISIDGVDVYIVGEDDLDEEGNIKAIITYDDLNMDETKAGKHEGKIIIYERPMINPSSPKIKLEKTFSFTLYEAQIAQNENVTIEIIPIPTIIDDEDVLVVITAKDNTSNVVIYVNDSQTPISLPLADCRYDENVGCYIIGSKELGLDKGQYKLKVSYPGEGTDALNLTGNVILITSSIKSNTQITAADKAYVINYGGTYSITLKNANGNVLAGKKVTFTLNGKAIGTVTTDAKGVASIKLTAATLKAAKAGKKNLIVKFEGDPNYNAINKTVKITINKEKTKITAKKKTFKKSKKVKKYTITLKNSKGKAVKKVKVTLKIKGKKFTAKTNKKGKAVFKIKKLTKKGTYKAKINFKATALYLKAAKKVKIKIK